MLLKYAEKKCDIYRRTAADVRRFVLFGLNTGAALWHNEKRCRWIADRTQKCGMCELSPSHSSEGEKQDCKKMQEKKNNCSMFLDSQMYFEVVHELTCGNNKLFSRFPTFHIRANEVSDKHKPSSLRGWLARSQFVINFIPFVMDHLTACTPV